MYKGSLLMSMDSCILVNLPTCGKCLSHNEPRKMCGFPFEHGKRSEKSPVVWIFPAPWHPAALKTRATGALFASSVAAPGALQELLVARQARLLPTLLKLLRRTTTRSTHLWLLESAARFP